MDDPQHESIEAVLAMAAGGGRIAVVGISQNPERPSNEMASYLLRQGFKISLVNPNITTVFGLPCFPDLQALGEPPDVVDVFRRSEDAGAVVDEVIAVGARAVWLQEGVIDESAADRARAAGLLVVMDRCILKEHSRGRAIP